MATNILTDLTIRGVKLGDPRDRMHDGDGLYLKLLKRGRLRTFRFDYKFNGVAQTISLGVYPNTSLAQARKNADAARKLLADGINPSAHRKAQKAAAKKDRENSIRREKGIPLLGSFHAKAIDWIKFKSISSQKNCWSEGHAKAVLCRLKCHIFPYLGDCKLDAITPPMILSVLRKIEAAEKFETASRALEHCSCIFRYAIAEGLIASDPCRDIRGALITADAQAHFPAILIPEKLGEFMCRAALYKGTASMRVALQLNALLFQRSNELRHAQWSEFNFEDRIWTIPANRMKGTRATKNLNIPHLVPLSTQVIQLLTSLRSLSLRSKYLFPGRNPKKPITGEGLTSALRRMGYAKAEVSIHGFRATANTMIKERLHVDGRVVEAQLAHVVDNPNGDAYDRAKWMYERDIMMQLWSDYLEQLTENFKDSTNFLSVTPSDLSDTATPQGSGLGFVQGMTIPYLGQPSSHL